MDHQAEVLRVIRGLQSLLVPDPIFFDQFSIGFDRRSASSREVSDIHRSQDLVSPQILEQTMHTDRRQRSYLELQVAAFKISLPASSSIRGGRNTSQYLRYL